MRSSRLPSVLAQEVEIVVMALIAFVFYSPGDLDALDANSRSPRYPSWTLHTRPFRQYEEKDSTKKT